MELRRLARESKSLRLMGFDNDPGKKMPNFQDTAIQAALNMRRKTTVKTQASWQLMEHMTHFSALFICPFLSP